MQDRHEGRQERQEGYGRGSQDQDHVRRGGRGESRSFGEAPYGARHREAPGGPRWQSEQSGHDGPYVGDSGGAYDPDYSRSAQRSRSREDQRYGDAGWATAGGGSTDTLYGGGRGGYSGYGSADHGDNQGQGYGYGQTAGRDEGYGRASGFGGGEHPGPGQGGHSGAPRHRGAVEDSFSRGASDAQGRADERDHDHGDRAQAGAKQYQPYGGGDRAQTYDADFDPHYLDWRRDQQASYDRDYHHWREARLRAHDDEYRSWRDQRRSQFHEEFNSWRQTRGDVPPGGDQPEGTYGASADMGELAEAGSTAGGGSGGQSKAIAEPSAEPAQRPDGT